MYRNEPTEKFDAHLFPADAVEDADGVGSMADTSVRSVCDRTAAYGPFYPAGREHVVENLPDHDGDLCGTCAAMWRSEHDDEADEVDA